MLSEGTRVNPELELELVLILIVLEDAL